MKTKTKLLGLGVLFLTAAGVGVGCDDDSDTNGIDAGGGTGGTALIDGAAGGSTGGDTAVADTAPTTTDAGVLSAKATLASVGGSTVTGTITFVQVGKEVTVTINVSGATPGQHGFHIHTNPSCADLPPAGDAGTDAGPTPAGAAGGHYNPNNMSHGSIEADGGMHHAGDFGNVTVSAAGTGTKVIKVTEWTVTDVLNRSVIFHAAIDDLATQPTGNSGGRVACGIIVAQ
jgi:superoxide dismutase, Cu-Zn family